MARPNLADKVKNLAGDLEAGAPTTSTDVFEGEEPRATKLRLADIEPDPEQPRVSPGDVSDLVASIKEHGLLQPLIVSPRGTNGKYRIIAGERRFTACNLVGVKVVDAIIRTDRDQNKLEIQLIENLHRKDLDPLKIGGGVQLQPRDLALLAGLFDSRLITVAQAARLFYRGSEDVADRRLRKLYEEADLLDRLPMKSLTGRPPAVYTIKKPGFDLLIECGLLPGD